MREPKCMSLNFCNLDLKQENMSKTNQHKNKQTKNCYPFLYMIKLFTYKHMKHTVTETNTILPLFQNVISRQ